MHRPKMGSLRRSGSIWARPVMVLLQKAAVPPIAKMLVTRFRRERNSSLTALASMRAATRSVASDGAAILSRRRRAVRECRRP